MAADVTQRKHRNNKLYVSAFKYIYIDEVQFGIAQLYLCLCFESNY